MGVNCETKQKTCFLPLFTLIRPFGKEISNSAKISLDEGAFCSEHTQTSGDKKREKLTTDIHQHIFPLHQNKYKMIGSKLHYVVILCAILTIQCRVRFKIKTYESKREVTMVMLFPNDDGLHL